jgi:hypothetical protein
LKPLSSAQTSLSYDEFSRMVMPIRHDLLKGITPEMVAWWFRNIGGDMEVEGKAPQQVSRLASSRSCSVATHSGRA